MTILPIGITETASADQTVAAGNVVTLIVEGNGRVFVQGKTNSGYTTLAGLGKYSQNGCQMAGPITFRVFRSAQSTPIGCSMETA